MITVIRKGCVEADTATGTTISSENGFCRPPVR